MGRKVKTLVLSLGWTRLRVALYRRERCFSVSVCLTSWRYWRLRRHGWTLGPLDFFWGRVIG